jgi:hypothetical protein
MVALVIVIEPSSVPAKAGAARQRVIITTMMRDKNFFMINFLSEIIFCFYI